MGTPRKTDVHQKGRKPEVENQGPLPKFWQELKKRKTIRVITIYSATSFIILQVADLIVQPLRLPSWTQTFLIILMLIGLVFAAALSWIYDITPEGIKKTTSQKPAINPSINKGTGNSSSWKAISLASIIIIIILLAFNINNRRGSRGFKDFSKLEKSVAVLPFRNDSPNDTNAYFVNGIMEEVLNHLQMVKDLRVISRTSVEQYRNTTKSIPEIAREQGVNFIVEGSGQKYGNSFTVKVQLIRAEKETNLWGKSYEQEIRGPGDIIGVQSQIAMSIASGLKATITPQVYNQIDKVPTSNINAYDFFQRGREQFFKYITNRNRLYLDQSEEFFRKSLGFDPVFAEAISSLALVYWNKALIDTDHSKSFMDSVLILSNLAIAYDNRLPEAYFAKGIYFLEQGQGEKAYAEFDNALEYNPNYWRAYIGKAFYYENIDLIRSIQNYKKATLLRHDNFSATIDRQIGYLFLISGHIEEAKKYYNMAFDIDQDSAFLLESMGEIESCTGNYEKSIEYFKQALLNKPDFSNVTVRLSESYLLLGKTDQAFKHAKEYIMLEPDDKRPHLAYILHLNGFQKDAEKLFSENLKINLKVLKEYNGFSDIRWTYFDLACIYAFRNEKENALKYLSLFSKNRFSGLNMLTLIKSDPMLKNIRNEAAFKQIQTRIENDYNALNNQVGLWLQNEGKDKN